MVLSVDVGATRVKAALIPYPLSFEDLQNIEVYTLPSKDWLNQEIASLFLPSKENVPSSFAKIMESELEKLADKYEIEISFEPKTKLEAPAEESSA